MKGEDVLARALAERQSLRSGTVRVCQLWELGDTVIERDETGYFDQQHYRLDIHHHSGFVRLYEVVKCPMPDPFAILIWDGQHVLRSAANLATTEWSLHPIEAPGFPFYNVRRLGLPLVKSPETDLLAAYRNVKVLRSSSDGALLTIVFKPERTASGHIVDSTATFTIDRSTGWSIVSYTIEEDAYGAHWTLKGETIPAKFGAVWFPAWHRHEQYRDGMLEWAREYHVLDAEFNQTLPAGTFTWQGTGIPPGRTVLSHVIGIPHFTWSPPRAAASRDVMSPDKQAAPAVPSPASDGALVPPDRN